ncbi:enolase C-terminal domain-like protein [Streptomyces sparsogenes]
MSLITPATALLADIAVETDRTDAVQSFVKQETRATTTGAITSLALAAVDTALWDLRWATSSHFDITVRPHFLMELHISLVAAVPNGAYVEHIPQPRAVTRSQMRLPDGRAVAPDEPGIGIDWDLDALDNRRVA